MLEKLQYFYPWNFIRAIVLNFYFNKSFDLKRLILISFDAKLKVDKTAKIVMEKGSKLNFGYLAHIFSHEKRAKLIMEQNANIIVKKGNAVAKKGVIVYVAKDTTLEIGENTVINANTKILAYADVKIGNNCIVGWETQIMSGDGHDIFDEEGKLMNPSKPITIEDDVWIGTRVTILKGVNIAKGAIIASNAVVVKDVPPNSIVVGNPARVVRENIRWQV